MEWLNAENVVAVGTAMLGIVASGVMVWYERRVPRRRRVGYRVQMDNPIGDDARSGRANRRLGLFDEAPGMIDATLVLLRIENDGSQGIDRDDYTSPEVHGLTAVFTDRTVKGVTVTQPTDTDHLMDHFTEVRGFGYDGHTLRIPRVPLNRGDHYKLLVLLSGGDVGSPIRLYGGIREGEVHPNRSATPDDVPPLFSRAARTISIMLTVCVLTLAAIVVVRDDTPPPVECAKGKLTVSGSTAFAPVVRDVAERFQHDCEGATVEVDAHGSTAGLRDLMSAGGRQGFPSLIVLSDGPKLAGMDALTEDRAALSVFALVVNDDVPLKNLSTDSVRRVYRGEITNWRQVGGPDLPVRMVSRDANSGTRQVFQRRVLDRSEMENTSSDCVQRDYAPQKGPVRCELDSTAQVLAQIRKTSGAIGYSELNVAERTKGLHPLKLDGDAPDLKAIEQGTSAYPYREVEYAYTYGNPPAGSLAANFLTYLIRGTGQTTIRSHGHLPCWSPQGLQLCAETVQPANSP